MRANGRSEKGAPVCALRCAVVRFRLSVAVAAEDAQDKQEKVEEVEVEV